jgi:hypothetical protein
MDFAVETFHIFAKALLQLLTQPFYYIGILFVILHYRRQMALERKLFSTRMHGMAGETLRTVLAGGAAGIAVSLVMAFVGTALTLDALLWVWGVSLLLMLVHVRFLCLAYSAGVIGLLQWLFGWFPDWPNETLGMIFNSLANVDVPSLLALAAVLHLAEAALIRLDGGRMASPLFLEGKRGKLIGGYHMQNYWPVPLLLLVPAAAAAPDLPWTPLTGGDAWNAGWTVAAFPAMIGFAELATARLPREKALKTSRRLGIYGIVGLALAVLSAYWPVFTVIAALAVLLLHELIVQLSRLEETRHSPLFVHDRTGLRVLAVIPGTPAHELGIRPGEVIRRINGETVLTKEELHRAMRANSAFCKLEVADRQGELRFLQRAVFDGEHHQLGIVLAPDDQAKHFVRIHRLPLFGYFRSRPAGYLNRNTDQSM